MASDPPADDVVSAVRPGRRRDPGIQQRALDATLEVYARAGLTGLTFNAIARESGVGKPALYRRWNDPLDLLVEAIEHVGFPGPRDCGSLRADLLDYGRRFAEWFLHNDVGLTMRVALDSREHSSLFDLYYVRVYRPRMDAARDMTQRALARGEITSASQALAAVEMLLGALNTHWLFTGASRREQLMRTLPEYVDSVVETIAVGLHLP